MSLQSNKELVRRYYEEIGNQRHYDAADEMFNPDFRMFPDSPPPYGPENVKQFLKWFIDETFPDLRVIIHDLIAEGDQVAAHVTLHGTQSRPLDGLWGFEKIPATGRSFTVNEMVFWRIENGKIAARTIVANPLEILGHIGASRLQAEFGQVVK